MLEIVAALQLIRVVDLHLLLARIANTFRAETGGPMSSRLLFAVVAVGAYGGGCALDAEDPGLASAALEVDALGAAVAPEPEQHGIVMQDTTDGSLRHLAVEDARGTSIVPTGDLAETRRADAARAGSADSPTDTEIAIAEARLRDPGERIRVMIALPDPPFPWRELRNDALTDADRASWMNRPGFSGGSRC